LTRGSGRFCLTSSREMKISDDYDAKFKLWAKNPKPQPELPALAVPKFKSRRFSSYEEMNQWKRELMEQMFEEIARNARSERGR
jgi:hypothetical protein